MTGKHPGGRPRRMDLYRRVHFHCSASADADISFVLGNAHTSGVLPVSMSRSDAICLCIEQVADMLRRERDGESIPWKGKPA